MDWSMMLLRNIFELINKVSYMDKKLMFLVLFCLLSLNARAVTNVDVLVIYTSQMNTYYSGNPSVRISQMISWANIAYQNSSSDINLNVVGSVMLDVSNGNEVSDTLLAGVADNNAHNNAAIISLKDQYKPDITVYLTKASSSLCGIAYLPKRVAADPRVVTYDPMLAVGIIGYDCDSYVLAHEVGHIFGAGHGVMDTSGGNGYPYAYSRGYGVQSLFADVMAYQWLYGSAAKLQIFSNPGKTCLGVPCGTSNDNAAVGIKNFAPTVANYSSCYPTITSPRTLTVHYCR
jgi:hypothetical protein